MAGASSAAKAPQESAKTPELGGPASSTCYVTTTMVIRKDKVMTARGCASTAWCTTAGSTRGSRAASRHGVGQHGAPRAATNTANNTANNAANSACIINLATATNQPGGTCTAATNTAALSMPRHSASSRGD